VELESRRDFETAAERLLRLADAKGKFPTPVDELVAAASLTEPGDSLLGSGVIAQAPAYLRRAMQRIGGRILGLIDRRAREVHLDPSISVEGRRRFIKLHETGHDALVWQREFAYADNQHTLSPAIRQLYDREASYFAAEVLFQRNRLREDAADLQIGLPAVIDLHNRFGGSLRATLWRYAERNSDAVAGVVLPAAPESTEPLAFRRREVTRSPSFALRFGEDPWPALLLGARFDFLTFAAGASVAPHGIIGGITPLADVNGELVSVRCEARCTGFDVLVLLWLPRSERTRRKLRLAG
jgi:hypothetical protein